MFLKSLSLRNIRCFDELTVAFTDADDKPRHWTVLLGENGAGKSTLLRAIALITVGSDGLAELMGEPDGWIRRGSKFCEIAAVLVTQKGEERALHLRVDKGDSISRVIRKNSDGLKPLDDALEHTARNYFMLGYGVSRRLSSTRSVSNFKSYFENVRAQSVATLFDPDVQLNPLESWAMDLDYRDKKTGMKTVRKAMADFLPGVSVSRIDKTKKQLLMKTPTGIVPLNHLSDGYQNVAAWIGDLLYRVTQTFDDYRSPLKTRGLLMIDEVALHLHPRWQRTLIDFLGSKLSNFQLVVTTHSPVTAQQASEGQLHYLRLVNGTPRLEAFEGNPQMLLLSQLMMTDVFGIETDESTRVHQTKEEYRSLKRKKTKTHADREKLKTLRAELKEMPDAATAGIAPTHLKLLRQINRELKKKTS